MSEKGGESGGDIEITVKLGGRSIKVSVTAESTVKELKSILQPLTDVLPRGQKLIYKGHHSNFPSFGFRLNFLWFIEWNLFGVLII